MICEFDALSAQPGSLIRSYIWGTDLSGSMQGAGGVGGLLKVTDYVGSTTHHFVAYDGNGNVASLVDAGTGAINARYEYGPLAEPIRTVGTMAKKMPFRFSTKYTDNESALIYYGYRFYTPSTGRWLSRDPIGVIGPSDEYAFLDEDPLERVDLFGLQNWPPPLPPGMPYYPYRPPPPPPPAPRPRPIPKSALRCCNDGKIKSGKDELDRRYKKAVDDAKKFGLKPSDPPPYGSGNATCKNSSSDVLEYLFQGGFPPCWLCYLQENNYFNKQDDPNDDRLDHQVVICLAYSEGGMKNEIIYDWWGGAKTPDDFNRHYRYPKRIVEAPFWSNCDDGKPRTQPPGCSQWGSCRAHD